MFTLIAENSKRASIELTNNEKNYQITNIEGLTPPKATINMTEYANGDGSSYDSSKIPNREIVITVYLSGNVQKNRIALYKVFGNKEWCKLSYSDAYRDVYIEGYTQVFSAPLFTQKQVVQITILCPDPYFKEADIIVQSISKIVSSFTFPFAINIDEPIPFSTVELEKVTTVANESEVETGLIIDAKFMGSVSKLEIKNVDTGENFVIDYDFIDGDKLIINCNRGSKSVTLTRDAVQYNLIPYVEKGMTWFQLGVGDNNFSFLADEGSEDMLVDIHFNYYKKYLGV